MRREGLIFLGILAAILIAAGGGALVYWKRSANAQKFLPVLNAAEDAYGIPRDLLARVAYQESHFRDDIINGTTRSAAGAVGIMQLVPKWHPNVNPLDPYEAINYAASYLRDLFGQFGTWKLALAGYNWGPGNLAKYRNQPGLWPAETLAYVSDIAKDVPVV